MTDTEKADLLEDLENAAFHAIGLDIEFDFRRTAAKRVAKAAMIVCEKAVKRGVTNERERCADVADANAMCASSYGLGDLIRKGPEDV